MALKRSCPCRPPSLVGVQSLNLNCKKWHGTRSVSEIFQTVQGTHGGMMQHGLMLLHADIFQGIHKIQVKVRERYILGGTGKQERKKGEH